MTTTLLETILPQISFYAIQEKDIYINVIIIRQDLVFYVHVLLRIWLYMHNSLAYNKEYGIINS
jgi:hypothetical protein